MIEGFAAGTDDTVEGEESSVLVPHSHRKCKEDGTLSCNPSKPPSPPQPSTDVTRTIHIPHHTPGPSHQFPPNVNCVSDPCVKTISSSLISTPSILSLSATLFLSFDSSILLKTHMTAMRMINTQTTAIKVMQMRMKKTNSGFVRLKRWEGEHGCGWRE